MSITALTIAPLRPPPTLIALTKDWSIFSMSIGYWFR